MAISEIRVYSVPLETRAKYNMSNSTVATPVSTVVEVVDSDGVIGYGEVCMASPQFQPAHGAGLVASLSVLAPAIVGLDPLKLSIVNAAMNSAMTGHSEGKASLDIACWDLIGKKLDQSVVDLLGGARMDDVITYHVVGIGSPDYAASEADRLQDEGITRIQLKAGGRPIHEDIASIRAVAAVIRPGTDLAVDTNRGWSTAEAVQVSNACADVTMSMEQPCATEAELQQVKSQIQHPIVVDENATDIGAVARMISSGLANGFGLKLSRLGGLTPMRAVRDLCMMTRTPMSSDDAWGSDIIGAAGVALGATLDPQFSRGAWLAHPYHQTHYDEINGPRIENGFATLPVGGPGLGLVLVEGQFGEPVAVYR
ncbi:MAG: L-alanine-DL-glutamate epimerase-like enolase superfamily enzyme [Verrucomicrobiales bacterium]|jgi:L-alanine-DL-glutamate epimerase-like enolase superfamily enzyme